MSEFGSGVVVCLAKFSQHLDPHNLERWKTVAGGMERAVTMVLYGASDHFYDLDREHAPKPLRELADLAFRYRLDEPEDGNAVWDEIMHLWRRSCEAVDRELGATPIEWGTW